MRGRESWIPWTKEDSAKLFELGSKHIRVSARAWQHIAAQFPGRTMDACKQHYGAMKAKADGKPERIRGCARNVNNRYVIHTPQDLVLKQNPAEPLRYASPFGEMLGEPPIGRSALDQKRMAATS